jgi:hypothetical protein
MDVLQLQPTNSTLDTSDRGWRQGRAGGDQACTEHFYSSFFPLRQLLRQLQNLNLLSMRI